MASSKSPKDRVRRKAQRNTVPFLRRHNAYTNRVISSDSPKPDNQAESRQSSENQDPLKHPSAASLSKPAHLQRPRVPQPLQLSRHGSSSLSAGPAGYTYTPLSLRTPDLESLRYDYGVQFKKRLTVKEVVLYAQWYLLLDEDALPCRIKDYGTQSLGHVKKCVRHTVMKLWTAVERVLDQA